MKIPLVITSELWHIGDLDNNTQGKRQSFEGNLLSASACPNAWEGIARLGGGKYYSLNQETMLVNMWEALKGADYEPLRLAVQQWALKRRLIEPGVIYVASYYDDELECEREMHFSSEAEAREEVDADECESGVESRSVFLATDALLKLHGLTRPMASSGLEYALIEWVRENTSRMIKGVYWDEKLDELGLSAPRAGMFSTKGFEERSALPDDEDCLAHVDFLTMEQYARGGRRADHGSELGL
ncbi:hypothetical protein [Pseudomonas amygdali]|uniref:Uncharacterized protein n=2 Tax=Pseudomonas amygdali pv. lachrymans TaxID=53707 RepID=A0ABR5KTG9_PSEAV|nr:hypothetical protein [Pseudomonas amygdali]AXH59565.1 hypothetical protein PLA107_030535 [Pseudomonas amygdali pv. lachrymans str. M301315]KPC16991.1 Uncharacterized protein AC499_0193 [Pseudomonas amygdali pv. lachrymans]KPC17950.1 Uncharacterized protein AC499_1152 [Pseudomonas amygdali pv. lachrymans]RMT06165.1 hypothetical protein ALP54_03486 [Pseudomonas amygdali pv. lachrymans]